MTTKIKDLYLFKVLIGNLFILDYLNVKILILWGFFFPEKPEENLYIAHKAITDLSLQETSVDEMTFREGKRNFHFVHRNCLMECGRQFLHGMLRECGIEKAIQVMLSKTQSCYRQIRESGFICGFHLRKHYTLYKTETAWIGKTDWHALT